MSWAIRVPFRDREDPLYEAAFAARDLPDPQERAIVRYVVVVLGTEHACGTVGDALDFLDRASHDARRKLLDRARAATGLPSTGDEDSRRGFEAANEVVARRPKLYADGAVQTCHAPKCNRFPTDSMGAVVPTRARKWYCSDHADQAAPGDLDEWVPQVRVQPGGGFEFVAEVDVEAARGRAQDEHRRGEFERRRRERAAEVEAIRAAEERYAERYRTDPYLNPLIGPGWAGK